MDFAMLLRDLMREREVSGRCLAGRVPCDQALISRLASGQKRPSARMASRLDEVLGASGALVEAARLGRDGRRWQALLGDGDDDVKRRAVLAAMVAGPLAWELEVEQVRLRLDSAAAAAAGERDADEWERVAAEYARQVYGVPAAKYLPHLLADAGEISERLLASSEGVLSRLLRSAALLAALAAAGLGALGEHLPAARWWRTAVRVAGESGDVDLLALILGKRAVLAMYGPGGGAEALALADHALGSSQGRVCSGTASAWKARAQACARLGRHGDAASALACFERVWERLPDADISARDSEWGQPERRMRFAKSCVLTQAGEAKAALAAQDAALAVYPASGRGGVQVQMHRAETLIRSGDVDGGARHCVSVLGSLPAVWRSDSLVMSSARAALAVVPAALRSREPVREAREFLALPAGTRLYR